MLHQRLPECCFKLDQIRYEDTVLGPCKFKQHGPLELRTEEEFVKGIELLEDLRIARGDMGSPGGSK